MNSFHIGLYSVCRTNIGMCPEIEPFCKNYLWSVSTWRAHLQIVWRVDRGNRAAEHLVQVLLSLSLVALVVAFLCRVPVLVLRAKPIWTGGTHSSDYVSPSAVLFHGLVDHLLCFSYFLIFFLFLWSGWPPHRWVRSRGSGQPLPPPSRDQWISWAGFFSTKR